MSKFVNLSRAFVERETYNPDELVVSEVAGKRLDWSKLLSARVAVIVAPANFGKTTEMQERARQLRAGSVAAVFVALRGMADRGSFEKALEAGERDAYDAWKANPTEEITLFVDSLDEAAAGLRDGIEYLVGDIAREVSWPSGRIRWVISTRPAVLTAEVLEKLDQILVVPLRGATVVTKPVPSKLSGSVSSAAASTYTSLGEPAKLRIFSMAPLSSKQAETFLTAVHPSVAATDLLLTARERGLSGFTTSPGGLDILAAIDLLKSPPNSLTDVFTRVVGAVQVLRGADGRLMDIGGSDLDNLVAAVQKLASASQICQLVNIEMPETKLRIPEKALSARLITTPMLNERVLSQLLNSQLFIDVAYHQVKLYPDELVPFLAAQRLSGLIQGPDQARKLVEHFSWSAPSGEQGVYRQFLPIMGWLATLSAHCREEILKRDPQAVAFFGDLRNPAVPLAAAKEALEQSILRLVEQGDHLGRGMFNLTSENFWQAGHATLLPVVQQLFDRFGAHHWARQALIDLVTASRSDALRGRVLKAHGNCYERLLEHSIDVRYLLEIGNAQDLEGFAAAVKGTESASESLVATLLDRLGWAYFTPKEVSQLIVSQYVRGRGGFHIGYALGSGELLDAATDKQLYELSRGLVVRVAQMRRRGPSQSPAHWSGHDRFVELTVNVLAALVQRTNSSNHKQQARLCLVLQRALSEDHVGTADTADLGNALQANTPVRRALLRMVVKRAGADERRLWMSVYAIPSACSYTADDIQALNDTTLNKVSAEVEAMRVARLRASANSPVRPSRADRLKVGAAAKKQLIGKHASLQDGTATLELAWIAAWLSRTNTNSRYGEVSYDVFEREAGRKIAQAVRKGLGRLWRLRPPRFDESAPRSTYHITAAGLQGLHLELGDGELLPALSEDEVRGALRYGLFEINGYPKWFWRVVEAHPMVALDEFATMIGEAGNGAVSREHAEELLTRSAEAPATVAKGLAPLAWKFLIEMKPLREYVIQRLLHAATIVPGTVPQREYERLANAKMKAAFKSSLSNAPSQELEARRGEAVLWAANWLTSYPTSFRKAVIDWGPTDEEGAREFIFRLAAHFGRDHSGGLFQLAEGSDEGVETLEMLYLWAMWAVRPEEDIEHPDGEAYSPVARDRASELRDILIPAIASAKSQAAYDVLERLRQAATGPRRMYLSKVQFEMREAEASRPAIHQQKYSQFEEEFQDDVTSFTAFAMAVHTDLLAIKYDIEQGEHSLRRFFTGVAFKSASKEGAEADAAGLALEADFQRLLASELNHHANRRYSVTVESHTAESKRRDVLCSKDEWRASIELKMSMRWTLEHYLEALEKQLVGQYMRHRHATVGFLVLVLQEKGRKWKNPATGAWVDFEGVLAILGEKARELATKDRTRYLRVIGIDATTPEDFREVRKRDAEVSSRKGTSGKARAVRSTGTAKKRNGKSVLLD